MSDGGDRTLRLYHTHTRETGDFTFKHNGRYDRAVLEQMNHFLRDWRNNKTTVMDPQLFDTLWALQQQVGGGRINIVSCFRSPETNHMLHARSRGVAEHSQHMLGKAMDIFIAGVPLEKLRETAMKMQVGGVGYYPTSGSPFVHVDTGNVRMWPRMTRSQLAQVFPNGNTLYVPSDGVPLPGYDVAATKFGSKTKDTQMAMLDARMGGGGGPRLTQAALRQSSPNTMGEKPNVASWLKKVFKEEDDSEDAQDAGPAASPDAGGSPAVAAAPAAPVLPPRGAAPTDLVASPASGGVIAMAPLPRGRPATDAPAEATDSTTDAAAGLLAFAPLPRGKPGSANDQMTVASIAPVAPAVSRAAPEASAVDAIADLTARMDVDTPLVANPVAVAASAKAADAVSALAGEAPALRSGSAAAAATQLGQSGMAAAPAVPPVAQLAYADAAPTSDYDTTYGGRYANTPRAVPRSAKPAAVAVAVVRAAAPAAAPKLQQLAMLQTPVAPVSRIVTPIGHATLRVDQAIADSVQPDDEGMRRLMSQLTTRTKAFASMAKPDPARGQVLFSTPATVADARSMNGGPALRTDRFAPRPVAPVATTASVEPTLLQRLFSSF